MLRYLLIACTIIITLFALLLFYWQLTANDVQLLLQRDKPFAVRLALQDDSKEDSLEFLAQAIIFPEFKRVLLYCINTDAHYDDELIREMSPNSADHFSNYTQIPSTEYIHIRKSQGERLLDIMEGITFFSEEAIFLEDAQYQYPQGTHYYPGEQFFEYIFKYRQKEELSKEEFYVERLFRQESMLLNFFWHRLEIASRLEEELKSILLDLISTSFIKAELNALFTYLLAKEVHLSVLEVPLELKKMKGKKILQVKEKRARELFRDRIAQGKIEWSKPRDDYAIQILNGTTIQGLARRVKFSLQNIGPQVLDVDNYEPKPLAHTTLVGRSGDTLALTRLMEIMDMRRDRISFHRNASDIDISLLIGSDFSLKKLRIK